MSTPTFAKTHNLIAYLEKLTESKGFAQIIDFLNRSSVKIQALVDGKRVNIKESSIRHTLRLDDAEGTSYLTNIEIFEGLAKIGYEKPYDKLTFYKAFFSPQWKFLIHTILQCLSAKTTSWNEFSSTMASAIIYLTTNQKFNFSRQAQIKLDEEVVRQLKAELNADINWNDVIKQVKRNERLNDVVMKYQTLKRKPLTQAQARRNMTIYLKNMAGFKMDYFKRMTYDEIRPLFEKHYNYNQAFLDEVNKGVKISEIEKALKGGYGLANAKSWKLIESCGVHCITFLTTHIFLLVERMYPLTHFTLEKMLNDVRLQVEDENEMSLELLSLVRRQLNEGYVP
nr:ribonuclease H-like domain, reverse transcriptase, RNA-dependent DNA polymerase [Tanacetum cinerariifolium]